MSAPTLNTSLDRERAGSMARFIHNEALAPELRARVAEAVPAGNEKSRERHLSGAAA